MTDPVFLPASETKLNFPQSPCCDSDRELQSSLPALAVCSSQVEALAATLPFPTGISLRLMCHLTWGVLTANTSVCFGEYPCCVFTQTP